MQTNEQSPELVDWVEEAPPGSRQFGFIPAFTLGTLTGAALFGGGFGFAHTHCRPSFIHRRRDFYSCSPRFVCRPAPFFP